MRVNAEASCAFFHCIELSESTADKRTKQRSFVQFLRDARDPVGTQNVFEDPSGCRVSNVCKANGCCLGSQTHYVHEQVVGEPLVRNDSTTANILQLNALPFRSYPSANIGKLLLYAP